MNDELLNALYLAYINKAFDGVAPIGGDIYKKVKEIEDRAQTFAAKLNLDKDDFYMLDYEILLELTSAAEHIGFINGLKLGARLMKALVGENGGVAK